MGEGDHASSWPVTATFRKVDHLGHVFRYPYSGGKRRVWHVASLLGPFTVTRVRPRTFLSVTSRLRLNRGIERGPGHRERRRERHESGPTGGVSGFVAYRSLIVTKRPRGRGGGCASRGSSVCRYLRHGPISTTFCVGGQYSSMVIGRQIWRYRSGRAQ